MKNFLLLLTFLACTQAAHADEVSKRAKIGKLIVAQGMEQMLQQQIDHSAASLANLGLNAFTSMPADAAIVHPVVLKKQKAIYAKFMKDAATIFTAKELVDSWSANYGKDLSESDIDQILAYYSSPIGQKDVASSKLAMTAFSQMFAKENEKRVVRLLDKFSKDLAAASNR